ncbi:MAG: hypothetical protein QM817_32160 [Archangium sp.]
MTLVLVTTLLVTQGGLLSEAVPRAGLLLEAQVAVTATPAATPKLADLTNEQLQAERRRLVDSAPSVLLPSLLIVGGAIGFTVGVGIFLFSTMVVGGIVMAIAAPVVITGLVLLLMQGPTRRDAAKQVKEIDRALFLRNQPPTVPELLPPPPPPTGV